MCISPVQKIITESISSASHIFWAHKSILTNVCPSIFSQIFRSSTRSPCWTHRRVVSKSLKKSTTWWTSGKRVLLSKIVNWEILSPQWKRWVSDVLSIRGKKKKPKEFAVSHLLYSFKDMCGSGHISHKHDKEWFISKVRSLDGGSLGVWGQYCSHRRMLPVHWQEVLLRYSEGHKWTDKSSCFVYSLPKVLWCLFLYFCDRLKTFGFEIEGWISDRR